MGAFALSLLSALGGASVAQGPVDPLLAGGVQWRAIGPANMGGRIVRLQVDETNSKTWYVAAASGGLWKTWNGGKNFHGLFQYESVNSIGDVAVSKSNSDIVWIGTGEHNPRNSAIYGNGVYKSEDGGNTWKHMGLEETRHIGRIAIHPKNPDIVYVGAMGRTWGPNQERGLFKTTDGGKSWRRVLFVNDQTGVIELQMDPSDPDTLLAATWQRQRQIYDDGEPEMSHGEGSAVWKTTDGGRSWTKISGRNGLPDSPLGRTGIDYCKKNPKVVYLITGAARLGRDKNGVWRSNDGGETWTKVNDTSPRPMYYSQIRVDPSDPETVFVLGVQLTKSTDGGKTFATAGRGTHPDHHCLWIDPDDSKHVLLGNDGGFYESSDGGATFQPLRKMALGQFYHVAADSRRDYRVGGGLQDNGTWYGPAIKRGGQGPTLGDFRTIGGGDGFVVRFDPSDPDLVYTESQNGNIGRRYLGPREKAPPGAVRRPAAPEGERERWAWKTDFVLSPQDPKTYYVAGQYLYKSTERGANLTRISPKLPLTQLGACTAIGLSPKNPDLIWVGTDDGGLWLTRDGGKNWAPIHDKVGMPVKCYVSTIEASRFAEGRCYVAFDAHRSNDDKPYLFATEDFGQSWTSLNANLPEFGSTRCLREDSSSENLLYCGTEFFAYASLDRGKSWLALNANLPTVAVHDFAISDAAGEIVAGTHGRSLWAMDVSWLREMKPELRAVDAYLFGPHPAVLWEGGNAPAQPPTDGVFVGENPTFGAAIYFYLGSGAANPTVTVLDASGGEVARLQVDSKRGLNRVVWGLDSGGQLVKPGYYRVRLVSGTVARERTLLVEADRQGGG